MHVHRVRDGRFIEHWELIDLHELLAQLTRRDGSAGTQAFVVTFPRDEGPFVDDPFFVVFWF